MLVLLDLGYAARFFAIGAYTTGIPQPGHRIGLETQLLVGDAVECPGWRPLFGVILGAPTLRVRGDYLAIITLALWRDCADCLSQSVAYRHPSRRLDPGGEF